MEDLADGSYMVVGALIVLYEDPDISVVAEDGPG